jgi:hypothetical protein
LQRHAECLLNQWLPDEVSLAQTGRKGDRQLAFAAQQTEPKPLIGGYFWRALNGLVENAIIRVLLPVPLGRREAKPAVAMTKEEERELREQLVRLQQEHRDLDVAIAALTSAPGSDVIQVQRLKKRKLVLRDRIRAIEDQLTPDIIA